MKNFNWQRRLLKEAGWKRRDRHNEELWRRPWDGLGFAPNLVQFRSAWRAYMKEHPNTVPPANGE